MWHQTRTGLAAVILTALITLAVACNFKRDRSPAEMKPAAARSILPARHKPFFQTGFAYSHIGGSYDSDASSLELRKMRAAGGTIVQLLVFAAVYRLNAPEIGIQSEHWDPILRGGMTRAKAAGLRTMIKLQVWGPGFDEGKFAADIQMTDAEG